MTAFHESNRRFPAPADHRSAEDWNSLLEHQADVTLADELTLFQSTPEWLAARSVIDAGCGNGYFLSRIAAYFPEKDYLGIDISPELIDLARRNHPRRTFIAGDYFTAAPGRAEIVLMRFLVQHLSDFGAVLRRSADLLLPGGALVIVESDLARSQILPQPRTFLTMLVEHQRVSALSGSVRTRLLAAADDLVRSTCEPWRLVATRETTTAKAGPFAGSKLLAVFRFWVDLAERSGTFAFDFDAVRRDLAQWGEQEAACVSLATRMFVLSPERS
ncbi:MAG: methyltransferase domain-containing protein [Bauldia sp.]|nr:methyltransferase domain-containing protein [Bauldia sp.]